MYVWSVQISGPTYTHVPHHRHEPFDIAPVDTHGHTLPANANAAGPNAEFLRYSSLYSDSPRVARAWHDGAAYACEGDVDPAIVPSVAPVADSAPAYGCAGEAIRSEAEGEGPDDANTSAPRVGLASPAAFVNTRASLGRTRPGPGPASQVGTKGDSGALRKRSTERQPFSAATREEPPGPRSESQPSRLNYPNYLNYSNEPRKNDSEADEASYIPCANHNHDKNYINSSSSHDTNYPSSSNKNKYKNNSDDGVNHTVHQSPFQRAHQDSPNDPTHPIRRLSIRNSHDSDSPGPSKNSNSAAKPALSNRAVKSSILVGGMSSANDSGAVERGLMRLAGVVRARAFLLTATAQVVHVPAAITVQQLVAEVRKLGFEAGVSPLSPAERDRRRFIVARGSEPTDDGTVAAKLSSHGGWDCNFFSAGVTEGVRRWRVIYEAEGFSNNVMFGVATPQLRGDTRDAFNTHGCFLSLGGEWKGPARLGTRPTPDPGVRARRISVGSVVEIVLDIPKRTLAFAVDGAAWGTWTEVDTQVFMYVFTQTIYSRLIWYKY
jgi:hypothetical protein